MKELETVLRGQKFNKRIMRFELQTKISLADWLNFIKNKMVSDMPDYFISASLVSKVFKTYVTTDDTLSYIIAWLPLK